MNRSIAAPLALICLSTPVFAQSDSAPIALDSVVVSGGLTPIAEEAYGRASSVITAEEIEDRGIVYAVDAIRALPGVSVSRTSGLGGLTQIRLRGAEGNHTLVLIDGIEVSAPQDGEYDFSALLASDIARLEVLRGPQSALYGSNAVGGVISIITKGASAQGRSFGGSLETGTDETVAGSGFFRYRDEKAALSISGAVRRTGGFDTSDDPGGKDDSDRNMTLNVKGEVFVTDWLTVGATGRMVDRKFDFDTFNFGAATRSGLVTEDNSFTDRTEVFASVYARAKSLGGRVEHLARAQYGQDNTESFAGNTPTADSSASRTALRYQITGAIDAPTLDAAQHRVTLAGEFERETFVNENPAIVFAPTQLDEQQREQFSIVGEYRGTFLDRLDLQLGLRQDFNDNFDDATTWSAGASYRLPSTGSRFHASAGTAVQNPSLFEQFGFTNDFLPNPDLQPEESFGWDVGIEQTFLDGDAVIDVTYFQQDLENEITADFSNFPAPATPLNQTGTSDRQGVEISAELYPTDWVDMRLSYTWLDAKNPDGSTETRRPKHEFGASLTTRFMEDRASLTLDGRYVAGNRDSDFTAASFGASQIKLDDYLVLNVNGAYRLNDKVELYGGARNLLDEEYQELDGYATEGLTGFLGVRAKW